MTATPQTRCRVDRTFRRNDLSGDIPYKDCARLLLLGLKFVETLCFHPTEMTLPSGASQGLGFEEAHLPEDRVLRPLWKKRVPVGGSQEACVLEPGAGLAPEASGRPRSSVPGPQLPGLPDRRRCVWPRGCLSPRSLLVLGLSPVRHHHEWQEAGSFPVLRTVTGFPYLSLRPRRCSFSRKTIPPGVNPRPHPLPSPQPKP